MRFWRGICGMNTIAGCVAMAGLGVLFVMVVAEIGLRYEYDRRIMCDADGVAIHYSEKAMANFVALGLTPMSMIFCPEIPGDGRQ